jgi:NAD(P)-dependent dehydrogenase (short-subunit alcohol dehydrogenase family)
MRANELIGRYEGTLEGSAALITGAGTGIGRACAAAFAVAGADVALFGRRPGPLDEVAALVEAQGRRALVVPGDVGDPDAVAAAAERTMAELGPVAVAVANAGTNAWADLDELTPAALRDALVTNVEGVANLARAVVPGMRAAGGGRIVVVASDNGRRAEPGGAAYVASKFGAVGFALSLSQELLPDQIHVHVIEPGCVDTPWYPAEEDAPRDRMLAPEEVALVALFLSTLPRGVVLDEVMMLPAGLQMEPW